MQIKKILITFLSLITSAQIRATPTLNINSNYASSIFIPRQLAYQPILENALTFDQINNDTDDKYHFALKPIYTQTTGSKFKRYFNINHQASLNVQENGTGDLDSLWFQVISSNPTYYSSNLSFAPVRQTYGSMLYCNLQLPKDFYLAFNTALIGAKHNLNSQELNITNLGTAQYQTVLESLTSNTRSYGRVAASKTKVGLDDIQIKLGKNFYSRNQTNLDFYALLGLPTSQGAKSIVLFEPLVGSKHVQLGLGLNYYNCFYQSDLRQVTFASELKWRYGFAANERRLFDLTQNGQWSRYMLLVTSTNKVDTFFASNSFALTAQVTPRNSFDLYLALNVKHLTWEFEAGYDLWFRNSEKIKLAKNTNLANNLGMADLPGIIALNPQSASTANISQGVVSGINQIVSDPSFVTITKEDLNLSSGAAPQAFSNTIYGSVGYCYAQVLIGLNGSYEVGSNPNSPSIFAAWLNFDFNF